MAYWLTIELEHGRIAPLPATMDISGDSLVYGSTIPNLLHQLDRIAQKLGVAELDRFIYKDSKGYRAILKEAEAEANAVLASAMRAEISILKERPRWHEPKTARQTIRSLKEFIATNPHVLVSEEATKWTLWDLEAYDRILADVEARGRKFAFVERN
jgi:hypothetical protein